MLLPLLLFVKLKQTTSQQQRSSTHLAHYISPKTKIMETDQNAKYILDANSPWSNGLWSNGPLSGDQWAAGPNLT